VGEQAVRVKILKEKAGDGRIFLRIGGPARQQILGVQKPAVAAAGTELGQQLPLGAACGDEAGFLRANVPIAFGAWRFRWDVGGLAHTFPPVCSESLVTNQQSCLAAVRRTAAILRTAAKQDS